MAIWTTKTNARGEGSELAILNEPHTIGEDEAGHIYLDELPLEIAGVALTIAGVAATEVTGAPAAGQYRVDYEGDGAGTLTFHASDAGKAVLVSYTGCGSALFARDINRLQAVAARTDQANLLLAPQTVQRSTAADWILLGQTVADSGVARVGLTAGGRLEWGAGGGAARDTALYRSGTGALTTDGAFLVGGRLTTQRLRVSAAADQYYALEVFRAAEPYSRLEINEGGGLKWGDGTAPHTSWLRQVAEGIMSLSGALILNGSIISSNITAQNVTPDVTVRMSLGQYPDGGPSAVWAWAIYYGQAHLTLTEGGESRAVFKAGGALVLGTDTGGTGLLRVGGAARFAVASASTAALDALVAGDTVARFTAQGDGALKWGAGGSSAQDVTLARSAAGRLTLTGTFEATSFVATPRLGTVDATSVKLATNNVDRFTLDSSGHLTADTDNLYKIGASSSANRPHSVHAGTAMTIAGYRVPVVIVSTAAASGSAPDGALWIQV